MAKLSFGAYPHMLGFEQLEQLLERTAKSSNDGYPPFNIEQTSDRSFRISLATAGFSEADLSITLENRQLVIKGKKNRDVSCGEGMDEICCAYSTGLTAISFGLFSAAP